MRIYISALLLVPAVALASSAFDGTWKSRLDSFKVAGKPDSFLLVDGEYTCSSCNPELKVKADGVSHKGTGHAYYHEAMGEVISPASIGPPIQQQGQEKVAPSAETPTGVGPVPSPSRLLVSSQVV